MTKNKKSKPHYNLTAKFAKQSQKEFVDYDYIDQLSEEEKAWLDQFSGEYYQGAFKKDTPPINPDKADCYARNNATNADAYNRLQRIDASLDWMNPEETLNQPSSEHQNPEAILIAQQELQTAKEVKDKLKQAKAVIAQEKKRKRDREYKRKLRQRKKNSECRQSEDAEVN